MKMLKNTKFQLALLLLLLILPSWTINIARVINVDEPRWMVRGSNFYYAVTHGEFENTIYEYHPGVTNMWVIGTAMHLYFPEYRGFGNGYFDPLKSKFEEFMREQGKSVIELVKISRFIHEFVLAGLTVTLFILLGSLFDLKTALLSSALAVVSPFFLGHSRLLNLEGMLSLFGVLSILAMQVYLKKDGKLFYLVLSGAAFGLAQLTKSSSIVVMGVIGLMLFIRLFDKGNRTISEKLVVAIKNFAIWFLVAAIVYGAIWPGMWVAPGRMLSDVYGNAFSYAFQGARLDVTENLEPDDFGFASGFDGVAHFLRLWFFSTTPLTWIGLIVVVIALSLKSETQFRKSAGPVVFYLAMLGFLFIAMFGLAKGRDSQHYILTSYVAFDVIAGIGWGYALTWVQPRWKLLSNQIVFLGATVLLILLQVGIGLPYAPYYFNYKAPFASEPATYGYGEGMSEAADYLAAKPNSENIRAYVYNGLGTFSFFFPGETVVLKRIFLIDDNFDEIKREMAKSDYLVLYPIVRSKQPETEKMLKPLESVKPEKIIYINGQEYIFIYKISDIPESVYAEIGQ